MQYKSFNKTYNVTAHKTKYLCDESLAITLEDADTHEPFATLTVNLSESGFSCEEDCAFVDTNNLPGAREFILSNELGLPTGRLGYSGYCIYLEYRFYLDKLEEHKYGD